MEVVWASAIHLIEKARDAHPQVNSLQRLCVMLARAVAHTHSDTIFTAWLKKTVDSFLTSFGIITDMVDDLTARLQAMRRDAYPTGVPPQVIAALTTSLDGLSRDNLFCALMALQLFEASPAALADVYMEVVVIAQRLSQHDELDLFISLLEQCVFQGTSGVNNARMAASLRRRDILDSFAKKHVNLAGTIAPRGRVTEIEDEGLSRISM